MDEPIKVGRTGNRRTAHGGAFEEPVWQEMQKQISTQTQAFNLQSDHQRRLYASRAGGPRR